MKKILICLFVSCICLSLFWITNRRSEKVTNANLYKELESIKIKEEDEESTAPEESVIADQRPLSEINTDYIGWLSIEGTIISYPVVKGEDNKSYLNLNFNKTKSIYGSIYLDYRNKEDDKIKIIYGHNTTDRQMFAPLLDYTDEKFAAEHQLISFADSDYKLISVNEVLVGEDDAYWNLMLYSEDRVKDVLQTYVDKSLFKSEAIINDANYLILSTCIQGMDEMRFILIVEEIQPG